MANRIITVLPPIGGVNVATGVQTQPPFTSFESANFWPIDFFTGRSISAVRPSLDPLGNQPGGSGTVNFMCRVNGVAVGKPLQSMVVGKGSDIYWYNSSNSWTAATGAQASSAPTDIAVYPATFLQKTFIPQVGLKPIVFDYPTGVAVTLVETAGTCPTDCRMFCVWQGALWQAGELANPQILYGSRTGDAFDWDFAAPLSDEGGAFFTGGENEGLLRGPITAIIPHTADTMIVSTLEGLVAFRGHPRRGGVVEDIVNTTSILGQGAWCRGPGGVLYYLTSQGMMMLPADSTAPPTKVSQNSIPINFLGPSGSQQYTYGDPRIAMQYDTKWNIIYMTNRASSGRGWFFDVRTGGFHEWTLPTGQDPATDFPYMSLEFEPILSSDSQSAVMHCGENGIYIFGGQGEEDFTAELGIGTIQLGADSTKMGMIESAKVMGRYDAVQNGTLTFAVGIDARDAIYNLSGANASFRYSVDLETLYNNNGMCQPKLAGAFVAMKLEVPALGGLSGNSFFALEEINLEVSPAGWIRRMRTNPN